MITKEINVNIRDIKAGDTVKHNGEILTVTKQNLSYDSFMGVSLFGDSYCLGRKPVTRVLIYRAMPNSEGVWQ